MNRAPEQTREVFASWAPVYDHENNPLRSLQDGLLERLVNAHYGDVILDAGCGTGKLLWWMRRAGAEVTGIDFSPEMLSLARSRFQQPRNILSLAFQEAEEPYFGPALLLRDLNEPLPFADDTFTKIVCSLVISYMADAAYTLSQFRRILKPRGSVFLSTRHPQADFASPAFVGMKYDLRGRDVMCNHSFDDLNEIFRRSCFYAARTVELTTSDENRHCFTAESFLREQGKPLGIIYELKKRELPQ